MPSKLFFPISGRFLFITFGFTVDNVVEILKMKNEIKPLPAKLTVVLFVGNQQNLSCVASRKSLFSAQLKCFIICRQNNYEDDSTNVINSV